ncbi:pyocin knob domain-containing protein [Clostridium baratii]
MGTYKTDWQLTETVMPEDMNRIEGNIKENNKSFNDFKRQYDNDTTEANKKIDRKADKVDVILKAPIRLDKKDLNTITEPGRYVCADCTNAPARYGRMDVLVCNEHKTAKWVTQIFYVDTRNEVFTRCSTNSEATAWTSWAEMYSTANKPTPADIGAQPKEATMFVNNGDYIGVRTEARKANQYYEFWDSVAGWAAAKFKEVYAGNGQYKVYHPGNKPTPADIGAAASDHNHDSLYLGKTAKAESAKNSDAVNGHIFNWAYGEGNPTHIWGSRGSSSNMQVWDPKNITVGRATNANKADAVAWGNITNKPETFSPSAHNHDDRYLKTSDIQFVNGELKAGDKTLVTTDPKVFWDAKSGGWVFDSGKVISLPKKISDMANGLMLLWSTRSGGTIHNYNYHWSYITKEHLKVGGGDIFLVVPYNDDQICTKRVGITETSIRGNDKNMNGNSTHVVLRKVVEW